MKTVYFKLPLNFREENLRFIYGGGDNEIIFEIKVRIFSLKWQFSLRVVTLKENALIMVIWPLYEMSVAPFMG